MSGDDTPAAGDDDDHESTSFFPSCIVNLTLRYDEALQVAETPADLDAADSTLADSLAQNGQATSAESALVSQTAGATRRRASLQSQSNLLAKRIATAQQAAVANPLSAPVQQGLVVALQQEKSAVDQQLNASTADPSSAQQTLPNTVERVGGSILIPLTYAGDGFTIITSRIPITGNFVLPHPREAGTFSMTFDYREFPIDPRLLRAVAVEIHLGCVSADDYARGMNGEVDSQGRPYSILRPNLDLKDPTSNEQEVDPSTFLMFGTVDRWTVEHSDHSSIVSLEGRDIRAIFIDTKLNIGSDQAVDATAGDYSAEATKLQTQIHELMAAAVEAGPGAAFMFGAQLQALQQKLATVQAAGASAVSSPTVTKRPTSLSQLNTKNPIDQVVADIIRTMTTDEDFKIYVHAAPTDWPNNEIPSPGDVDGLTRVRAKADGQSPSMTPGNAQGGGGAGDKSNYWDLITNYCALVGAIPYLFHNSLWIRPARSVFDVLDDTTSSTFFANGKPRTVGDETITVRRFIWGRNLKNLKLDRKFAGPTVPTVQAVSIDDRVRGFGRLLVGQWPPADSQAAQSKAANEILKIPVPGIRSIERLTDIAHDVYEEIGRGEMGGSAETENLSSYGGTNADADVVRMRPTEPVQFLVDARVLSTTSPLTSELNDAARRSFEEEVEAVYQKLGDRDLARSVVSLARGAIPELLDKYQICRVAFDWSSADGVKANFDFQNYIVSRHGADPDEPAAGTKPQVQRTLVQTNGQNRKAKRSKFVQSLPTAQGGSGSRGSGGRRRGR